MRRRRTSLGLITIFALFTLVVLAPLLNFKSTSSMGEGNPLRQASYFVIFGLAVGATLIDPRRRKLLVIPGSLVLMLGWCWLSLTWSIALDIAVRRLILTTVIVWTVFLAVDKETPDRVFNLMRLFMVIVLIANYAAALAFPAFGTHLVKEVGDPGLVGNWRGVLLQKNFAGAFCAFTIIFFIFDCARVSHIKRWAMIVATAYFLYRTHSKTSVAILALSIALGFAYTKYNPRYRAFLFAGIGFIGLALFFVAYGYWDEIVQPFAGEDALTGRVQIWPVLIDYWQEHWWGAGYGSFWNIGADGPVFQYAKGWVTNLGNGHNGYLDLLTQIGLPGVVLAAGTMFIWPTYRLLVSLVVVPQQGALLLACLFFCGGHNMTESSLLDRDAIVQVFLVLTIALIGVVTNASATRRAGDGQH